MAKVEKTKWVLPAPGEDPFKSVMGRRIKTLEGPVVKIESLAGNIVKPTRMDVNGKYQVLILDLYALMNNETYTQKDRQIFDNSSSSMTITQSQNGGQPWQSPTANPPKLKI